MPQPRPVADQRLVGDFHLVVAGGRVDARHHQPGIGQRVQGRDGFLALLNKVGDAVLKVATGFRPG